MTCVHIPNAAAEELRGQQASGSGCLHVSVAFLLFFLTKIEREAVQGLVGCLYDSIALLQRPSFVCCTVARISVGWW